MMDGPCPTCGLHLSEHTDEVATDHIITHIADPDTSKMEIVQLAGFVIEFTHELLCGTTTVGEIRACHTILNLYAEIFITANERIEQVNKL